MLLKWQTYRSELTRPAEAVVDELWHRFRALYALPVELMVVRPGKYSEFDVLVFCRSRQSLTWVWLAHDALTPAQRSLVRIQPYTITEAKRDPTLADILREYLGWKKPTKRASPSSAGF